MKKSILRKVTFLLVWFALIVKPSGMAGELPSQQIPASERRDSQTVSSLSSLVSSSQDLSLHTNASGQIDADPSKYLFYPQSPIHLGGGLSPNNLADPKIDCVDAEPYDLDHGAALQTSFLKTLVTNNEQLKQALSLDANVDASYLAFKGGASYSYRSESQFTSNSLTLVLTAATTYSRRGLRNVRLNDNGKKWIGDGSKFAQFCGTRLANVEYDASMTSIILTITNVTAEDHSSVTASLSAQGGWGLLNASASAKFDEQLSKNVGSGQYDIQVVATGGTGLSGLGTLLGSLAKSGSLTSIQAIQNAMGTYLTTFSSSNAAPIAYDVTSMASLGWTANEMDLWTDIKERNLRMIVGQYRQLSSKVDTIDSVLSGSDPRASMLTSDEAASLPGLRNNYMQFMQELAKKHQSCMTAASDSCDVPTHPDWIKNPIPDLLAPPLDILVL